ncbi:hypothetical protein [Rudanella paleaurantiibacter]|uniref:hypothetical protein n=1 Tax=Rudanella paleaurantiibacter TaxID=2614655 RepID=UPI0016259419|nr:hypothetical protein [Rudanella paleaurantiibacter]
MRQECAVFQHLLPTGLVINTSGNFAQAMVIRSVNGGTGLPNSSTPTGYFIL